MDKLCARLTTRSSDDTLSAGQIDLLNRCNGIVSTEDPVEQNNAYEELSANDFVAIRTQALGFSDIQYTGVMSRLATARGGGGGRGLFDFDFGGLTLNISGKSVPVYYLQSAVKQFWDMFGKQGEDWGTPDESPLGERLGVWLRSNYNHGDKDISPASNGFENKQWGFTGGADYRLGERSVLGMALGYGRSGVEFLPMDGGRLDTGSWTASVYGSAYPVGDIYVDAVVNYGAANYDTSRHIVYTEGGNPIDRTAAGTTSGRTFSAGLSAGYDMNFGGLTLSPTVGYFHSRAQVSPFDESGASGLDLSYGDQNYKSSTLTASFAANYAWSLPSFVVVPHVRCEHLHEMTNDVEVFGLRFANDPFANASNPSPPIVVPSDAPDQWYWRFAAGVSTQFKHGVSGFVEYQRLAQFSYVNFESLTFGLRFQRSL